MKLIKITLIFGVFALLNACKRDDSLNVENLSAVSNETTWASESTADLFLNDIYGTLPDLYNGVFDPIENWSDNSMCGFNWTTTANTIRTLNTLTPTAELGINWNGRGGQWMYWNNLYGNIRKINIYITNVGSSTALSQAYKDKRLGEAYFFRAFNYQYLWMLYGGVPLISKPDNTATDADVNHPRAGFDDTYKFIIADLDAAIKVLPTNNGNSGHGRITLGAVLTLKSWVELFYASKQNNPSNDLGRWAAAAADAKKVMALGYSLYPKYDELFLQTGNNNNEGILYREYLAVIKGSNVIGYQGPQSIGSTVLSWGGMNPTQDLVDDYAMANGMGINESGSGYDPNHPNANREPRFYKSIVCDGSTFAGQVYNTYTGKFNGASANQTIDLSDANDNTNTGYSMRKKLDTTVNIFQSGASGQNYYFFRYAEVLLNYAEAQNEAVGPDASVYAALDLIRNRAGIPTISSVYPGLSQDNMRAVIRKERRVELAFEDKRYWDLIRWKIADVNLNRKERAMLVEASGSTKTYKVIDAPRGQRTFDVGKNYLMPIPQSAISQNKLLVQNPGY
ncbi:RagB/SusD family nutrient uptake outer membrane protein [Pedobacter sp. UBA5917]|jgi:hypothetical protein|uniref:RagB/SusD family nutrient uptake outer membrane protein n=1 Tax=Pedobacter sp. UBA5917 TaxID=1947061 RepID=UPI0025CC798E|nr:RagB/SusD family nutrient uptake outer membrane protein [Pedobacter sp. UBA5917]